MRFKKKLYWDLILRYLVFLISAVLATALFLGGIIFILINTMSKYPDSIKDAYGHLNEIEYDENTKELNLSKPIEEKAWIEILKDNKVVFVQGEKQDDKMEYTQEELACIANDVDELVSSDNLTYEFIPFTGLDGQKYTFLLKKPIQKTVGFRMGFDLPPSLIGTNFEKELNGRLNTVFWIFLFTLIVIILLFSRVTSKKIIKPLKELNKGLENVVEGDYSFRLDFKGNYEFEQLRDAFNYMTERLETAERENKRISESKKRLLLDISHDLRTPATTIQGYAQALCNDMVESHDKKKKYLNYIHEKSKHVTNLIETLFKYSKLESSVYDLNREVSDLCEFLRNVVISFYGELDEKDFNLDIQIPNRRIDFNFDKIELERVFSNIIGNIIKYNPRNTTLLVWLEENTDCIQIIIEDNGVGIPNNIQKNIFDTLVRGDNTRKTDGGMGLGLAIAKKIIELHGGKITLKSEERIGTKIFINFKR